MAKLMNQCMARRAGLECQVDIGIGHPWKLMALLREVSNVILEGFTQLFLETI
jgi:hypothetical protein